MSINQQLLNKGFKQIGILLIFLILSPLALNIGFKALNKYPSESIWIAYIILGISFLLIIITLALAFKAFKTLLDAIFNSN